MASKLRSGLGTRISFFAFQDIITSVTGILILITLILTLYLDKAAPPASAEQPLKEQLAATVRDLARINLENELRQTNLLALPVPPDAQPLKAQIGQLQLQFEANSNRLATLSREGLAEYLQASNRTELLIGDLKDHVKRTEQELDALRQTNTALVARIKAIQKELEQKRQALGGGDNPWFIIPDAHPDGKQPVLLTVSATNLTAERFNQPEAKRVFPAAELPSGLARLLALWRPQRDCLVFYVRPSGIALFTECLGRAKAAGFQTGFDAVDETQTLVFSSPALP